MRKNYLYDEVLVKNPVLVGTIGLCPVVAICTSFKIALIMSAITILTLLIAQVLTSVVLKKLPQWVRLGLYTLIGMIVVVPAMFIVNKASPELMLAFGIYFPLLAVNPLIVRNCEREAVDASLSNAILTSLFAGLGYSAVLLIVGLIRQLIPLSVMVMPAGGFIVIAFLAALLHVVFRKVDPKFADELIETSRTNIHEKPKAKLALNGATYEDGTAPTPKMAKPKLEVMTLEEAEERKAAALPPVETTEQTELAPTDIEEVAEEAEAPVAVEEAAPSKPLTDKTSRFEFITLDLSEESKADADARKFAEAVAKSKEEKIQRQMNKRGQRRKVRDNEEGEE